MPLENRIESPFVGPRPFTKGDAKQFFGRERETNNLVSLIYANPAVLFYAPSGAGKSSLLNAAVLPRVEEEFEVFPSARFSQPTGSATSTAFVNTYVGSTLMSWIAGGFGIDGSEPELANISLADFLAQCPRSADEFGDANLRLIIFEQFEEILTAASAGRAEERRGFFAQLGQALETDPRLRVLFVLREEFIGAIEPYLPPLGIRPARFRIERLNAAEALDAIQRPLEGTGRRFTAAAARKLVDNLRTVRIAMPSGEIETELGEFAEPVQLQVVCGSLWSALPLSATEITEENLNTFGGVDRALINLYETSIAAAVHESGIREARLRRWCEEQLITPIETRGLVLREAAKTAGIPTRAIEKLESLRLVRVTLHAGAIWYELSHDRLIEPVLRSNREWLSSRNWLQQRLGL